MVFAAQDWAKAFDSMLHHALARFGVPVKFANVVAAIYRDREFFVRYRYRLGTTSTTFRHLTGMPVIAFSVSHRDDGPST